MNREPLFQNGTSVDDRIDERCDEFELAWRGGERPSIADYIRSGDEPHRNTLFCELLLVELECRRTLGEQPTEEQYLHDYPEFTNQIHAAKFQYGVTAFSTISANGENTVQAIARQRGSQFAHFELLERLGAGAMGEAWKAWDTRLKRNVTIKLPHNNSLTKNELRRFLREGEAAAQLSHPQLACVHETRNDGGTFYIVATYVEGKNLREHTAARHFGFDEIVALCASVGEALQCAHDKGVVHRDLKPANIIIDPDGLPHIIDFGLARILDADHDLTVNGELLGTPAYMSPELASGNVAKADARTDVYSLGVIFYELLTGRCPFVGNPRSVISQILACESAPPRSLRSSIPRDLETICLKAIEKAPESRYATVRGLAEDLRRYASGQPIRARRVGISEKSWRWFCRHPGLTAFALLLLAAIVATSATIASLRNRNLRLAGFRPVRITTTPSGAHVAIVPVNASTNEPDPDPAGIVRPSEATPLTTQLKAGTYLVEAVLPGGQTPDFVEVYRTVLAPSNLPESFMRKNKQLGLEPNTCLFGDITILPQANLIKEKVQVLVSQQARTRNPLLPSKLYVDANQTIPTELQLNEKFKRLLSVTNNGEPCMSYPSANRWAELNQTRLPSSAEYDMIIAAVERGEARSVRTGEPVKMDDLFDNYPEWSTTMQSDSRIGGNRAARHLRGLHVLKGFTRSNELIHFFSWVDDSLLSHTETRSPRISIRGVRSATPRFVKP